MTNPIQVTGISYNGVRATTPPQFITLTFDPGPTLTNQILGTFALNTTNRKLWRLAGFDNPGSGVLADWVLVGGAAGDVAILHTDDGNNVTPTAGVINIHAGNGIATTGTAGPNTVTISTTGNVATQYDTDSLIAIPAAGILEVFGGSGIQTAAGPSNRITITSTTPGAANSFITSPATGTAVPTGGQLTFVSGTGISISAAGSSVTINASGTSTFTYTNVTTTPYVVLTTDEYLSVDTSSIAITVELPNAPATGRSFIIKDRTGNAATNNITVRSVSGAVNIDGATTFVMNTAYESINVLFDGTSYEVF